jgi:S1-C subfamily serine protease
MAAAESRGVLAALSDELAGAVAQASAAVVTVEARRRLGASGVVWQEGGAIVTADHVLEREEDINVTLADGSKTTATIAGRDPGSDIAVLKLAGGSATPATLAPADSVKVGHLVLALGRPSGGAPMASFGVVSAVGGAWRTARGGMIEGYIRADVTLYPGFSGGPLVDTQGRVVALNSYYLARGQEIALPASAVTAIVTTLLSEGRIRRAYLGVTSQPVQIPSAIRQALGTDQETGLMIIGVEADSPADKGGLLIGDVLTSVGDRRVADPEDLRSALVSGMVGAATSITVIRGGQRKELSVTPGERT